MLKMAGFPDVKTFEDGRLLLPYLAEHPVGLIVLDLFMPHVNGETLLAGIKDEYPHIPVLIMTAASDIDTAIRCMKSGAFDYFTKPVESSRL